MKEIDENYKGGDRETITQLINQLKSKGYEIKINIYNQDRKELRIIAK
ncbi:MAG: hypothetical protein ACOCQN_00615 [Halanaerobiaceae bacterium]